MSNTEYFVEVHIEFAGERRDPRGEEYGDDVAEFYGAVSELLGAGEFDSPMTLQVDGLETYVCITAESSTEAATNAERLLSEASERVWGPGYRVGREGNHGRRKGPGAW